MSKTKINVCRICLRSDVGARDVDETINDFYDEICEYDTYENQSLKYCRMCEHQLRKCYNFKQKCLRANAIIKAWKKKKLTIFPKNLHVLLPPPSLGFCSATAKHKVTEFTYTDHGPESHDADNTTEKEHFREIEKVDVNDIDKDNDTEVTEFAKHFLREDLLGNNSPISDSEDNLTDIKVSNSDIKELDLDIGLKEENDESDSWDTDDIDSDLDDVLEKYIKNENKKPNTRSKGKVGALKVKAKKADKAKKVAVRKEKVSEDKNVEFGDVSVEDDKTPQTNKKYLSIKEKICEMLDRGEVQDLGDNSKMTREIFEKIYEKFLLSDMRMLSLKKDSQGQYTKLRKALLHLLKKYNPDYETVFDIEYLDTEEKKLNEFNRRKEGKSYVDAPFKCAECYRGFEKQTQFEYHNKWHTASAGEFLCGICGMRFQSLKTRASHRASSHSAVYACKMCPLITYHYPVMLNHYEQHKGVEYSCPICLSVFENKTTFMNHQRDHNADKKKSTCTSCAATFISDVGLMLHRKSKHTDDVPINAGVHSTCQECNITFDTEEVYMKHVTLAHTKKIESYRCAYCHIRFSSLEELRTHKVEQGHQRASKKYAQRSQRSNDPNPVKKIKINTPDKPFVKCELCPAMVSTAYTSCMYKHFLKDHPDIPYSSVYSQTARRLLCDLCGKTFMDPAFFADHANTHTGLKPYLCTQCPARFATRRHLGLHAQRHGPARHVCNHCGKRFHSAANLFNHRKTHIGDRRFKCEICFKGFLHAATLNEHVRGVHHHIRKQKPPRDRKISY